MEVIVPLRRATAVAVVLALGAGCASTSSPVSVDPGAGASPALAPVALPDGLDPAGLAALAAERSPRLGVARARVARLGEGVPQVSSLPDPMVTITAGELAETAAGRVQAVVGASQRIPFPGKLDARAELVRRDVEAAGAELDLARVELDAGVRDAYWELYAIERSIEITRDSQALLEEMAAIARSRLRVGRAAQADALSAGLAVSRSEERLVRLGDRRARAVARLNALLHRPADAPIAAPAPVEPRARRLDADALLERALAAHPMLESERASVARAREQLEVASLERYPDFTVNASYGFVGEDGLSRVANGDDQWSLGLGVTLPLWPGRLDAAEREAGHALAERRERLAGAGDRLRERVADALSRVESRGDLAEIFRERLVPEARQRFEASLPGYAAGTLDFSSLLESWEGLLDVQLAEQLNVAELEQATAALAAAVGVSVDELEQPGGAP